MSLKDTMGPSRQTCLCSLIMLIIYSSAMLSLHLVDVQDTELLHSDRHVAHGFRLLKKANPGFEDCFRMAFRTQKWLSTMLYWLRDVRLEALS